jgi:hydroxymethylglutaryl-CoA lyase
MERTIGRRLRSEAIINGRTEKAGHPRFGRPGLKKLIEKLGEKPGTLAPPEWPAQAILPEKWGPADPVWKK